MERNRAQEEAIETQEGQLLIISCPGSGKTTTMIRRIGRMLERGIEGSSILMLTFSKASAVEMEERFKKEYGEQGVHFGTIHAFCYQLLSKYQGLSTENIIKENEVRRFFYEQLYYNKGINDKESFVQDLLLDITTVKNNLLPWREYEPQCTNDKELFQKLFEKYEECKSRGGQIDFDDMLFYAYRLLRENQEIVKELRDKYRYLQVDEYQDINILQRNIIYMIAGQDGNLAVVGDDDQCIYGFRGSRPDLMIHFKEDYPKAKVVYMETNYRSKQNIIKVAKKLIKNNKERYEKEIVGYKEDSGILTERVLDTREDEIRKVVEDVRKIERGGQDLEEIAVLYRTNTQAERIAELFLEKKIPFQSPDKINSKFEHWIFQDIISYHRMSEGTGSRADMSRSLTHPQRWLLSPKYTEKGLNKEHMYEVARKQNKEDWKKEKAYNNIDEYVRTIKQLKGATPSETMRILERRVGYYRNLRKEAEFRNKDVSEYHEMWDSYKEFFSKYDDWDELMGAIEHYNYRLGEAQRKKEGVILSTMHKSKGLEWSQVFIIDAVEHFHPFHKSETKEELEEERRLFYVAVTRAKDHLYLYSYKKNNGKSAKLSPYLQEIKESTRV